LADPPKASLNLKARRLDLSPLLQLGSSVIDPAQISLASRIELAGNRLSFNDIDAGIGGSRLRGRLAVVLGNDNAVEGEAGIDRIDLAPVFQMAIGAAGRDQSEPLGQGLLRGWRGKVSFQALRGTLPGGSELQPLSGVIRNDGQALIIESKARIGGGDGSAEFSARPSELGTALNLQLRLSGFDAAALRYRGLALPAGRAALQMTLDSTGRSASALNGALSGGGTLTLESARIAGLDPQAFAAAIRAGDAGQPIDDKTLERIVEPLLSAGALPVAAAQIPFSVKDGRLRVTSTTLESQGARAVVSGGYDILADQADIRASLVSTAAGAAALRPEIQIDWVGPPDGMQRSIDVAALSSWLAGRRIDRETRKLEQLERETAPPPVPAALPPPIKPLPLEKSAPAATLPPELAPDPPTATVPPERDPRPPSKPKTIAPRPQSAPEASRASPDREQAAPLPPPIEVRPAPGDTRPQRLRPPLVLTPQNPPRAAF
jgi:large subunit ribosomal protein L24